MERKLLSLPYLRKSTLDLNFVEFIVITECSLPTACLDICVSGIMWDYVKTRQCQFASKAGASGQFSLNM